MMLLEILCHCDKPCTHEVIAKNFRMFACDDHLQMIVDELTAVTDGEYTCLIDSCSLAVCPFEHGAA